MKVRRGARPRSVRLFAAAFGLVAVIGLLLALSAPHLTRLLWAKRIPAFDWTIDAALVASISMFTIALIPILWICVFAAARARWVVLVFGLCKIGLWVQGYAVVDYGPIAQMLRWLEPLLIIAALILLFSPSSARWLTNDRDCDARPFE